MCAAAMMLVFSNKQNSMSAEQYSFSSTIHAVMRAHFLTL
ncbi:hypothetical protein HMPREF1584_00260 [Gardnerella vaginalis JCP8481A]|uniref:Uncharacterized protein n=1 Tax=Gardnerella vaginalis TaxID=2702 RepID=A0A133NSQ7_GARVA|nr:hypothetical protein HMPREF1585_00547 [Gardnerella vaginalis JCP8481B]EPI44352.1 hypothetical protein HMPREF1584_00260 [Gardnerella vaginalis JCP8481A]KXA19323.1 hypothetical protein HMPREF3208_01084 [Gardnerella vaginalis]